MAIRDERALGAIRPEVQLEIELHRFGQFLFFRQWQSLRAYARRKDVRIIGDLPIYVAEDSADVWANPELFTQGEDRRPKLIAGVPPDYFSSTGQLWGNPIYDWDRHFQTGYRWWVDRVKAALKLVDVIRFDHFRGIESFWSVPFGSATAENGTWLPGPARLCFPPSRTRSEVCRSLPRTSASLRRRSMHCGNALAYPVCEFCSSPLAARRNLRFLPHRFSPNLVVYTGTHDNDTTAGWAEKLSESERSQFCRYSPAACTDPVRSLLRLAWASVADLAIAPIQDLLVLGSSARLNTPGQPRGNWEWRISEKALSDGAWKSWLAEATQTYERRNT